MDTTLGGGSVSPAWWPGGQVTSQGYLQLNGSGSCIPDAPGGSCRSRPARVGSEPPGCSECLSQCEHKRACNETIAFHHKVLLETHPYKVQKLQKFRLSSCSQACPSSSGTRMFWKCSPISTVAREWHSIKVKISGQQISLPGGVQGLERRRGSGQ